MPTAYGGFQLGLLPERKVNKRAMMTSYALVALLLLIVINIGLILPEKLQLAQYHVTEIDPNAVVAAGTGPSASQSPRFKPSCFLQ